MDEDEPDLGCLSPWEVQARAQQFSQWLQARPEENIIVFGHGAIFAVLLGCKTQVNAAPLSHLLLRSQLTQSLPVFVVYVGQNCEVRTCSWPPKSFPPRSKVKVEGAAPRPKSAKK